MPQDVTLHNCATGAGTNLLAVDAWGRPKFTSDYSLTHALFTYSVPNRVYLSEEL